MAMGDASINIRDLERSIRNSGARLKKLRHYEPVYSANGVGATKQLIMASAGFSAVFKMRDSIRHKSYALKCFHVIQKDRKERYAKIAHHLNAVRPNWMAEFNYFDEELSVTPTGEKKDVMCPVLSMEWIEGSTLGVRLAELCKIGNQKKLHELTVKWSKLAQQLVNSEIAHGDLKPDNVMIRTASGDELLLVDYDSMYVPGLAGYQAADEGGPSFQHPKRGTASFNQKIDHFSILVMCINMRALSLNPGIPSGPLDDANLLFRAEDFVAPQKSKMLTAMFALSDQWLTEALSTLRESCLSNSIEIPKLKQLLSFLTLIQEPRQSVRRTSRHAATAPKSNQVKGTFVGVQPSNAAPLQVQNQIVSIVRKYPRQANVTRGKHLPTRNALASVLPFGAIVGFVLAVSWVYRLQNGVKSNNVDATVVVADKRMVPQPAPQREDNATSIKKIEDSAPIDYRISVPSNGPSELFYLPIDYCSVLSNPNNVDAYVVFNGQLFKQVKGGPSPKLVFKSKSGETEVAEVKIARMSSSFCRDNGY